METMQRKRSQNQMALWVLVAMLVFHQSLLFPAVMCRTFEDQKTYYPSPDPHSGGSHRGSHRRPPHHHRSQSPPSHGGSGTPSPGGNCSPTPSDPRPSPSHGGGSGSHHYSPPTSGGSPPLVPTPDVPTPFIPSPLVPTPTDPTPPSSGGYQYPPPISGGSPPLVPTPDVPSPLVPTPTDPTPPSSGGYQYPPPISGGSPPLVPTPDVPSPFVPTPIDPTPPSSGGYQYSPPSSGGGGGSDPVITTPPIIPVDPRFQTPPMPLIPDPSSFPGTCDFWRTHPQAIWGIFGWWGTLGGAFGGISDPSFSPDSSLLAALSNPRRDGIGALYREGTASLLNSMVNTKFPFTTDQVKQLFAKALTSQKDAAAQAELFQKANEGRMKPRA